MLRARLGADIALQTLGYGEPVSVGGVQVSLHPRRARARLGPGAAGPPRGAVWVASGDYKLDPDPTCAPFEPVRCNVFITEILRPAHLPLARLRHPVR